MAYINGKEILFSSNANVNVVNAEIVQETGDSETAVMSQKATTDALTNSKQELTIFPFFNDGVCVVWETGVTAKSDGYCCTDIIPIEERRVNNDITYVGKIGSNRAATLAFYADKSEETFISTVRAWNNDPITITIPEGAKYYRMSCLKEDKTRAYIKFNVESAIGNLTNKINSLTVKENTEWE